MKTIPLRHAAQVLVSNVDKKSYDGGLPVRLCNYTDVYKNHNVAPHDGLMRATATAEELARFRLRCEDSIITKDSESMDDIGIPAFVTATAHDFVCGYHLAILRPLPDVVDGRFLNWSLHSALTKAHMSSRASGMTRYGLTYGSIQDTLIALPLFAEQRRIAEFLDGRVSRIDSIISARRRQADLIALSFASIRSDYIERDFVEFAGAPVRRFVANVEQGSSPAASDRPAGLGEWGVVKTSAIKFGSFHPDMNKALEPDAVIDPNLEVKDGDLLVTRGSGSSALVGDVAVARLDRGGPRLLLSDLTYRLRTPTASPDYLAQCLLSSQVRADLGSRVRQGTGPAKARGEDILNLRVPAASPVAQRRTTEAIQEARIKMRLTTTGLEHSIALLSEYKQSLITAAVTGELDVATASKTSPA